MKTLIENNELIAEFMRWDVNSPTTFPPHLHQEEETQGFWELRFDTDWNWLIPVVEKIESIGYYLNMNYLSCHGCIIVSNKGKATNKYIEVASVNSIPNKYASNPPTAQNPAHVMEFDCPKEALYNLVLRFINWYNESK